MRNELIENELGIVKDMIIDDYIERHSEQFDKLSSEEYRALKINTSDDLCLKALGEFEDIKMAKRIIGRYDENKITLAQYRKMIEVALDKSQTDISMEDRIYNYIRENNIDCELKTYEVKMFTINAEGKSYGMVHYVKATSKDEAIKNCIKNEHLTQEKIKERKLQFEAKEVK